MDTNPFLVKPNKFFVSAPSFYRQHNLPLGFAARKRLFISKPLPETLWPKRKEVTQHQVGLAKDFPQVKFRDALADLLETRIREHLAAGTVQHRQSFSTRDQLCQRYAMSEHEAEIVLSRLSVKGCLERHKTAGHVIDDPAQRQVDPIRKRGVKADFVLLHLLRQFSQLGENTKIPKFRELATNLSQILKQSVSLREVERMILALGGPNECLRKTDRKTWLVSNPSRIAALRQLHETKLQGIRLTDSIHEVGERTQQTTNRICKLAQAHPAWQVGTQGQLASVLNLSEVEVQRALAQLRRKNQVIDVAEGKLHVIPFNPQAKLPIALMICATRLQQILLARQQISLPELTQELQAECPGIDSATVSRSVCKPFIERGWVVVVKDQGYHRQQTMPTERDALCKALKIPNLTDPQKQWLLYKTGRLERSEEGTFTPASRVLQTKRDQYKPLIKALFRKRPKHTYTTDEIIERLNAKGIVLAKSSVHMICRGFIREGWLEGKLGIGGGYRVIGEIPPDPAS